MINNFNNKFFYWYPRIISILYTIFIYAYFADIYRRNFTWLSLFGSLIPGTIILIATLIAWNQKYVKIGASILIIWGLLFLIISALNLSLMAVLILSLPPLIAGLFFLLPLLK